MGLTQRDGAPSTERFPASLYKESQTMLVLSRKLNEKIVLDGGIRITVVGLRGNQVRIGIEAPDSIKIVREELCTSALVAAARTPIHLD
jgi:carbon storage regulator